MTKHSLPVVACAASACAIFSAPAVTSAQVGPDGIDWVTVGAVGNAPWPGNGTRPDLAIGRGSVGYEYKIGRFEVTTSQWAEFFNAAYDRNPNDRLPHMLPPDHWGAVSTTPNTPGGLRWSVPAGREMLPVGDISWRMAAMYCNWLCNDKRADRAAFLNGAYDVSTFGYTGPNGDIFTDQRAHTPGARYWIPTWDETLKAFHYDPNRANPDGTRGGYWLYSYTSDTPLPGGPPPSRGGTGFANYGFYSPSPFSIPLGSYNVTSPWGLYDTAGATGEWSESVYSTLDGRPYRYFDGSYWTSAQGQSISELAHQRWSG